jgi:XTP/dITP diphosphohydrolase
MEFSKIVLASNNAGKLREFSQMFKSLGIEILPQGDLNIPASPEPHLTFVENALEKARHASRLSGLPALADDSGVCVEALNGAPGIYSARFSGEDATDAKNNQYLIKKLQGQSNRRAHYACVLVLVRHEKDPEPIIAHGQWFGEIIDEPRGTEGFGYDPHFLITELGKTAAELDPATKNQLGHRGQALQKLLTTLHPLKTVDSK